MATPTYAYQRTEFGNNLPRWMTYRRSDHVFLGHVVQLRRKTYRAELPNVHTSIAPKCTIDFESRDAAADWLNRQNLQRVEDLSAKAAQVTQGRATMRQVILLYVTVDASPDRASELADLLSDHVESFSSEVVGCNADDPEPEPKEGQ